MTQLTIFGLFSVTAMLAFYGLEKRSTWFVLAFAFSCLLGSAYGFLQGAWPFGIVEFTWAGIAVPAAGGCLLSNGQVKIRHAESPQFSDPLA